MFVFPAGGAPNLFGKTIGHSLRFNSADSAYMSRTFGTPTDSKRWTFSAWVKRSALGAGALFHAYSGASNYDAIQFDSNDKLVYYCWTGSYYAERRSAAVYRDLGHWMHVCVAFDSTQATAADRVKVYVNGSQVSYSSTVDPPLNGNGYTNTALGHNLGTRSGPTDLFNGYLADVCFVDGTALDASYFGRTNGKTGEWTPKSVVGVASGNNGFYLSFADGTSTTTLGYDDAGSNDWTLTNFTRSSGTNDDWLTDTPTTNYATLSALDAFDGATVSDGGLKIATAASGYGLTRCSFAMSSGKWYCEFQATSLGADSLMVGIAGEAVGRGSYLGSDSAGWSYIATTGNKYNGGSGTPYGATWTTSDVVGIAFDAGAGTLTFYKNGVSQGTAFSGLAAGTYYFAVSDNGASGGSAGYFNFGQRAFSYTPPIGFQALSARNLPEPAILNPVKYFDIATWTGTGASNERNLAGAFQPNIVWIKNRDNASAYAPRVFDSVRGATKELYTNATTAETTDANSLTSFDADGFTVGSAAGVNGSGNGLVAWAWRSGATPGIGINQISHTNGVASSAPHGLGTTPKMLIRKLLGGTSEWDVWHAGLSSGYYVRLESTAAQASGTYNSADATNVYIAAAAPSGTYIMYSFVEVPGFSRIGKYTGNGNANGPFVWCGFRPALVIRKRIDAAGNWTMVDAARDPYNDVDNYLYANLGNVELVDTTADIDFLSNGFKVRSTASDDNASGGSYVFLAFADSPFRYNRAR